VRRRGREGGGRRKKTKWAVVLEFLNHLVGDHELASRCLGRSVPIELSAALCRYNNAPSQARSLSTVSEVGFAIDGDLRTDHCIPVCGIWTRWREGVSLSS
jgi:hypothetical protein